MKIWKGDRFNTAFYFSTLKRNQQLNNNSILEKKHIYPF